MTASERLGYRVGTARFFALGQKLARLNRGRGGRPPFAPIAPASPLPHQRVENSYRSILDLSTLRASDRASRAFREAFAEAEAANRVSWAGARGTGWNSAAPGTPRSSAGGALARIGGGAGA